MRLWVKQLCPGGNKVKPAILNTKGYSQGHKVIYPGLPLENFLECIYQI